jgi:endoglucanase
MNSHRSDSLIRAIDTPRPRREVLRALAGGAASSFGLTAASVTRLVHARVASVPAGRLDHLHRGDNLAYWFWYGPPTPEEIDAVITATDIDFLVSVGFDFVRLPVDLYLLLDWDQPSKPKADAFALLKRGIERLLAGDLAVIVELHNFVEDAEGRDFGDRLEKDDTFVDIFIEFWIALAKRLKKYDPDLVLFGIMNEPVFLDDRARWAEIQLRTAAAIRKVAPDHTIIATGNFWTGIDGLTALTALPDSNVLYDFHFYEPYQFTHQGADWTDPLWGGSA